MSKGYMYILKCSNGKYYIGSTKDLELRIAQHQNGEGSNFTKKHLPLKLVYYEEYQRIDEAFYREKQVQGWSKKKKEALINGEFEKLPELSRNYKEYGVSTGSTTVLDAEKEKLVEHISTNALGVKKEANPTKLVEPVETSS